MSYVETPLAPDPPPPLPTDRSLLRRFKGGDEQAAAALYLRYAHRLRALAEKRVGGYAGRFDADDVVQSVFRVFFHGVRRQAYEAPESGELWGLLMVLALSKIRTLVGHHRAGKRAVQRTASVADFGRDQVLARDENAAAFLRLVLEEQMAELPASNREIIRLRTLGYEVGEIVDRTGRSRRTVERVLQDFRARLSET